MDNLIYSDEAINVLDEFYEVDKILYVEGVDDKVFWEIIFNKFYQNTIEIIDVDGIENLKPYIEKIENNVIINAYVACDQDYNFFKGKIWHKNVICTFGHSIENSLFLKENLCDVIRGFSKSNQRKLILNKFDEWSLSFVKDISDLIYCDIYNEKNKLGKSIIGENCDRFLIKKDSCIFSSLIINKHLNKIFEENEIQEIKKTISCYNFSILNFIRGHFLFSAAMRFVTVLSSELSGKKVSIAKDAFFSNILIAFEKNFMINPHASYYENKVRSLS